MKRRTMIDCSHYVEESPKTESIRFRVDEETKKMLDEIKDYYGRPKSEVFKSFVKSTMRQLEEDRKRENDYYRRINDIESIRKMIEDGEDPDKIREHIRYIYNVFR